MYWKYNLFSPFQNIMYSSIQPLHYIKKNKQTTNHHYSCFMFFVFFSDVLDWTSAISIRINRLVRASGNILNRMLLDATKRWIFQQHHRLHPLKRRRSCAGQIWNPRRPQKSEGAVRNRRRRQSSVRNPKSQVNIKWLLRRAKCLVEWFSLNTD